METSTTETKVKSISELLEERRDEIIEKIKLNKEAKSKERSYRTKQGMCRICKLPARIGLDIHYSHKELGITIMMLVNKHEKLFRKLPTKSNATRKIQYSEEPIDRSNLSALIQKHFDEEHKPGWLSEYPDFLAKKKQYKIKGSYSKEIKKLGYDLVNSRITDQEFLDKIKLLAYTNALSHPEKVTVKSGLDAVKLSLEKEKLGVQKSESLRNWMKLISGKPDKENVIEMKKTVVEGETIDSN